MTPLVRAETWRVAYELSVFVRIYYLQMGGAIGDAR